MIKDAFMKASLGQPKGLQKFKSFGVREATFDELQEGGEDARKI